MSKELVEKVARVICASSGDDPDMVFTGFEDPAWMEWVDNAKPAIRAVLSHFAEAGNVTEAMCEVVDKATADEIHKQQDGENWVLWIRRLRQTAIAAAMAAALKEMEG